MAHEFEQDPNFEEKIERLAQIFNTFYPEENYTGKDLLEFMESNVIGRTHIIHMIVMLEKVEGLKQDAEEMKKSFVQLGKLGLSMDKDKADHTD